MGFQRVGTLWRSLRQSLKFASKTALPPAIFFRFPKPLKLSHQVSATSAIVQEARMESCLNCVREWRTRMRMKRRSGDGNFALLSQ